MIKNKIKIGDKNLAKTIRKALGIKYRQTMTISEMEQIKKLKLHDIEDLTGLEYAINLNELTIYGSDIKNFNVISKLSNLRKLYIYDNAEFDINIISQLQHLREIYLDWKYLNKFMLPNKNNTKISYSTLLNKVLEVNRFTNKQKVAVEKYLFNPSEESAIKAIKTTPKASIFVIGDLGEKIIEQAIKEAIQDPKINIRYLRELVKHPVYEKLFIKNASNLASKKAKKFLMEYIFDKDSVLITNHSFNGYNWYRSKISSGYIL
ncbi:hypothetical protein AB2T63_04760 [Clostridium butyricum]|uniref:hypothetical protein n=1 Tax=Clostridium butyricum TaxID=1492 RepID=UPI003466AAA2